MIRDASGEWICTEMRFVEAGALSIIGEYQVDELPLQNDSIMMNKRRAAANTCN